MSKQIDRDDVQTVADDLNIKVNRKKVNWIIENFEEHAADDPTSTWVEVVENMLFMDIESRSNLWTYTVQELKSELSRRGFYTDCLWKVDDVFNKFDCTHEQALDILGEALNHDTIMDDIHEKINDVGDEYGLKKVVND